MVARIVEAVEAGAAVYVELGAGGAVGVGVDVATEVAFTVGSATVGPGLRGGSPCTEEYIKRNAQAPIPLNVNNDASNALVDMAPAAISGIGVVPRQSEGVGAIRLYRAGWSYIALSRTQEPGLAAGTREQN